MQNRRTLVLLFALGFMAIAAISCDIFSPEPETEPITVTLYSTPALDGQLTWVEDEVYTFSADSLAVSIGDLVNDTGCVQAYVSFDLNDIPVGANISKAILRLYQTNELSGTSYADLLHVYVDNVHYTALNASNELFNGSTTGSDIGAGPLASSYSADTWHELSVLDSAKDEFAHYHNGMLQFRFYHNYENDNENDSDTDAWAMGEDSEHRPQLILTYTL